MTDLKKQERLAAQTHIDFLASLLSMHIFTDILFDWMVEDDCLCVTCECDKESDLPCLECLEKLIVRLEKAVAKRKGMCVRRGF